MDDLRFRELLRHFGLSWAGYRRVRKGVKKRITRHKHTLGCRNMTEYLTHLDGSDAVRRKCERLMTVSISRFFRDQRLWDVLEKEILPELICKQKGNLAVWSAGCAGGEEAYSFKILWNELGKGVRHLPNLEIIGTDMSPACLSRSRTGIYPFSSLREVPENFRAMYFEKPTPGKELYAVTSALKQGILWKTHNLFDDPPGADFHIIFLRNNLLTYYENPLKKKGFIKIAASLAHSGFLIIGSNEHLPFEANDLIPFGSCPYIFRKSLLSES